MSEGEVSGVVVTSASVGRSGHWRRRATALFAYGLSVQTVWELIQSRLRTSPLSTQDLRTVHPQPSNDAKITR